MRTPLRSLAALVAAALLVAGAGASALADKGQEKAETAAMTLVKKGLAAGDKNAVIKGLGDLGGQGEGEDVAKFILDIALDKLDRTKFSSEASNDIFDAAEDALSKIKDAKGEAYIFEQATNAKRTRWEVRVFLVDVIAKRTSGAVEATLIKALDDPHVNVQKNAIAHLGIRKSTKAIDPIIAIFGKVEKKRDEPWFDAKRFLETITGKTFETAFDWKGWWDANKGTFDPAKVAAGPTRTGGKAGETSEREVPELFGTEVLSKKCVFILDVSGSMLIKDPGHEKGSGARGTGKGTVGPKDAGYGDVPMERMRMHRLKEAMKKLIEELPSDTQFSIVTFGSQARSWNNDLIPANAKNKAEAVEFAESMNPEGFTVTDEALREAFAISGEPDTFYLFSDGVPQRGKNADGTPQRIDLKEILEEVERLNRVRKVKIFTIGIGEADANFMRQIAVSNGGTFTAVD